MQGWAVPVIQRLQGSSEGAAELWESMQRTPVKEFVSLCEDRLGVSNLVTGFVNKLLSYLLQPPFS